jgi:hypothetical protein
MPYNCTIESLKVSNWALAATGNSKAATIKYSKGFFIKNKKGYAANARCFCFYEHRLPDDALKLSKPGRSFPIKNTNIP